MNQSQQYKNLDYRNLGQNFSLISTTTGNANSGNVTNLPDTINVPKGHILALTDIAVNKVDTVQLIAVADPAAGNDFNYTTIGEQHLLSAFYSLTTGIDVTVRQAALTAADSGLDYMETYTEITQAASLLYHYSFLVGVNDISAVSLTGNRLKIELPANFIVPNGLIIKSRVSNIIVPDQISNIRLLFGQHQNKIKNIIVTFVKEVYTFSLGILGSKYLETPLYLDSGVWRVTVLHNDGYSYPIDVLLLGSLFPIEN